MGDAAKTSLISSGLQKPDVILFKIVNGLRHPVVLIEVESSSDVLSTANNLANGIMCQIIYLRNTGQTISTLKGFFIPFRDGNAEEITVKFDENRLTFNCKRIPVTREEIIPAIVEAWNNQKSSFPLQPSLGLTLPISSELIRGRFTDSAFQVRSGLSVVMHDPTNRCYYKYSLMDNLIQLDLLDDPDKARLSVYPTDHIKFLSKNFFKYPQVTPFTKEEISTSVHLLIELVNGTVKALLNLHSSGYAHNYVRIENICFREDTDEVVLIDLERRRAVGLPPIQYGMSTMYASMDEGQAQNWTPIKIDFRQLAIMIIDLQSDNHIDYHAIVVEQTAHVFLRKLFFQGMLNVVYLA